MPTRLVINPVVTQNGTRRAKCVTLLDPGRPYQFVDDDGNTVDAFKEYGGSSAIGDGNTCLSLVRGVDMSALDADSQIVTLFEAGSDQAWENFRDWLGSTPSGLGWSNPKQNRIKNRITAAGGDATGLTSTTPLWRWAIALGAVLVPGWDPRVITVLILDD